jgi:hypothetical protein
MGSLVEPVLSPRWVPTSSRCSQYNARNDALGRRHPLLEFEHGDTEFWWGGCGMVGGVDDEDELRLVCSITWEDVAHSGARGRGRIECNYGIIVTYT